MARRTAGGPPLPKPTMLDAGAKAPGPQKPGTDPFPNSELQPLKVDLFQHQHASKAGRLSRPFAPLIPWSR
jgi:hypothetical protein